MDNMELTAEHGTNLSPSMLFFNVDPRGESLGDIGGRALDLYVEWMVSDPLVISPLLGFCPPSAALNRAVRSGAVTTPNSTCSWHRATFFRMPGMHSLFRVCPMLIVP